MGTAKSLDRPVTAITAATNQDQARASGLDLRDQDSVTEQIPADLDHHKQQRPIWEELSCDTIFGAFLIDKAASGNSERTFENNLKMVLLYRDCFSLMARLDLLDLTHVEHANSRKSGIKDTATGTNKGHAPPQDFEALNYPDLLPTISNEFVLRYAADLSEKAWMPKREKLIKMVEDFCGWLRRRDYTLNALVRNALNRR